MQALKLVEVPVAQDPGTAQMVSDLCTAEGIRNELVLGTDHYALLSRTHAHRIVIAVDDLPAVEQLMADVGLGLMADPIEHAAPTRSARSRRLRLLFGMPLLAVALALILIGAITVLRAVSAFS